MSQQSSMQMSQGLGLSLPLPEPCSYVKLREEMLWMWQMINDWWSLKQAVEGQVPEQEDSGKSKAERKKRRKARGAPVREYGPCIQLACKVLRKRLLDYVGDRRDLVAELMAVEQLCKASKMISALPQIQELYKWGSTSSLKLTFERGDGLFSSTASDWRNPLLAAKDRKIPWEQVEECWKVWRLIYLAAESFRGEAVKLVNAKDIKRRLEWLEKIKDARVLEMATVSPSSPALTVPGLINDLVSQLDQEFEVFLAQRGRGPAPPTLQPIAEGVEAGLCRIDEEAEEQRRHVAKLAMAKSRCLVFVDGEVIGAPTSGMTGCRARPSARDLVALATDMCLSDLVIDAYLCLVCHYGNRHLPIAAAQGEKAGSPKWHAWSTEIGRSLVEKEAMVGTRSNWPPPLYPGARLADVNHHVFPILLDKDHWIMAVLHQEAGSYRLELYSSIKDQRYVQGFERLWPRVEKWMIANGLTDAGLRNVKCTEPQQPEQRNVVDCGVFILCEARWLMEEKPLSTLLPEEIRQLRRKMAAELEVWQLL